MDAAAESGKVRSDRVQRFFSAGTGGNGSAGFGERQRDRSADASTASAYHDALAGELYFHDDLS
jgi:hypothetical protein